MYLSSQKHRLDLPESLRAKMFAFRKRVWAIKLAEAGCGAVFGVLTAYLVTYCLDRLWDTPAGVRFGIFWAAIAGCTLVPLALHRWIWRQRRLEQLARLLSRTYPSIGDQLLGIIELVRSESEQARSMALCEAAVEQVAEQAQLARLHERRAEPEAPPPGRIRGRGRRRRRRAPGPLPAGRGERLGAVPDALARHAALHVRAWSDELPDRLTWSRTASRSRCRSQRRRADRLPAGRG